MAQFRATIRGQRGVTSRLGSKKSGLDAAVNGWNGGVRVIARHINGRDVFEVYSTGGSNGGRRERRIGIVDGVGEFIPEVRS